MATFTNLHNKANGLSASWSTSLDNRKIDSINYVIGTTKTETKKDDIIDSYCRSLPCDFVKCITNVKRKEQGISNSTRVLWQMKDIPYDGTPFCVLSYEILKCTFSMNYNHKKKKSEDSNSEHANVTENNSSSLCPAKITVKKLKRFPSFTLSLNASKREKLEKLKELKRVLDEKNKIEEEEIYWLCIPLPSYHNHEFLGKERCINKNILEFIKQKINIGIHSPKELKALISSQVKEMFKNCDNPPSLEDEAYYPTEGNIRYVVYNIAKREKNSEEQLLCSFERNIEGCINKDSRGSNDNNESVLWKPNSLQDVVEAYCKSPIKEDQNLTLVQQPVPPSVLILREKISVEINRIIDFVNNTDNTSKLEHILSCLQNLANYEDTLIGNIVVGDACVSVMSPYEFTSL